MGTKNPLRSSPPGPRAADRGTATGAARRRVHPNPPNNSPSAGQQTGGQTPQTTEERGDVGILGFWQRGRQAIFDVRITDTRARSHRGRGFEKVLAAQEKEKKDKYLRSCLEQRKDFTPMVYSVEGIPGREARNAERHLATLLAAKWRRPRARMVFYVRVRMAVAVVRANSLLFRGSRDRAKACPTMMGDGAALSDWQLRQEA